MIVTWCYRRSEIGNSLFVNAHSLPPNTAVRHRSAPFPRQSQRFKLTICPTFWPRYKRQSRAARGRRSEPLTAALRPSRLIPQWRWSGAQRPAWMPSGSPRTAQRGYGVRQLDEEQCSPRGLHGGGSIGAMKASGPRESTGAEMASYDPWSRRIGPKAAASYAAYSRVIIISGVAITPVAIICLGLGFRSKIIPLYRARVSPDCLVVRAPVCWTRFLRGAASKHPSIRVHDNKTQLPAEEPAPLRRVA